VASIGEEKHHQDSSVTNSEEHKTDHPSPEKIAFAMEHRFSTNPYDHVPSHHAAKSQDPATSLAATAATACSLFHAQERPADNRNVPTGCVGAYTRAVKAAAAKVTRLVKASRKANAKALSPEARRALGVRFIDACTSDSKLPIAQEILREDRASMDVDSFFIGPDDTETCALHAAAFHGAEDVLRFLCRGIDERDPDLDGGLCDVNVQDGNGWTALHFAAGANSVTSVRVLARNGANLTVEASNGYTPFHWAERLSNEDVAAELEVLGADNRFVGGWMFGNGGGEDGRMPLVSFLAHRFFGVTR